MKFFCLSNTFLDIPNYFVPKIHGFWVLLKIEHFMATMVLQQLPHMSIE
jgi:hypothetical protein